MRLFRTVDAGGGVLFQRHGTLDLAPLHGLLSGFDLGGDAGLMIAYPTAGEEEAGACGNDEK